MPFGLLNRRVRFDAPGARGTRSAGNTPRASWPVAALALAAAILPPEAVRAQTAATLPPLPALNLAHFDHLISAARLHGETVDVLNIYSRAPDFAFVTAPGEGYACVDDAARGVVLLAAMLDKGGNAHDRDEMSSLIRFVLNMQNDNGYFNNFIEDGGRINTSYETSAARLDWWSLRALWGLEAAYRHLPRESDLARRVVGSTDRLVHNLERDLPPRRHAAAQAGAVGLPDWLPAGSGADQAAVAILGLLPHYAREPRPATLALITSLADGIVAMQAGDARHYPYGAHLSWRNTWHAWGSDQAYALLLAGKQLKRPDYTASGLAEVDRFYPYLLRRGYLSDLTLGRSGGRYVMLQAHDYPQIAYGVRPMVFAADEAYRITGKTAYRVLARRFAVWLTGANSAHRATYDPASGRVADGIEASNKVNPNSGAESTVEGLLILERLNGAARR